MTSGRSVRRERDGSFSSRRGETEKNEIPSLKIRYNQVFGYYIEVTKSNLHLVPAHYERKQTLVNAERFITPELKEFETKVLGAEETICQLEYRLFEEIREPVAAGYRTPENGIGHRSA